MKPKVSRRKEIIKIRAEKQGKGKKTAQIVIDTDNSMVIARGNGGQEEVEEGIGSYKW